MRLLLVYVLLAAPWVGQDPTAGTLTPVLVSRQDLVQAMNRQKAHGYNLLATANGARFSAGVILDVARQASQRDPDRTPLLIDNADYFEAYLEVMGLTPDAAPTFMKVAAEHGEDQYIDYREENVIAEVVEGTAPLFAVNVIAGWSDGPDAPDEYRYEDRTSNPPLRVTHQRINGYRLLEYGDMLVWDDIHGISGRALGGLLGAMFKVLGDGRAVRSFMALSNDGLQVTVTTASKAFIRITQEAVVYPDGRGEKGLPSGRDDLKAIESRLRQPYEVQFAPLALEDPFTEGR